MSTSGDGGDDRPRVVILGGCGFLGRNLVELLVAGKLASAIRVVDKTPPQTAWLNPRHTAIFQDPIVTFRSANLISPASCTAALEPECDGWDVVVNCAGETRGGQSEAVYEEGILTLSRNVAEACLATGVGRLVEISSAFVYPTDSKPHSEADASEGWTVEGRHKLLVETELADLAPKLKYTVLRPALAYGPADARSLTPRLLVGAVYRHLGESMKLLWTRDLKLNTVHVRDVCRAIWHVARHPAAIGNVYNVVDTADSTQGTVTDLIAQLFDIQHEYVGTALSTLAKAELNTIAEEANDKHLCAWARACAADDVANTPLEPSTRPEMLLNNHLAIDGAALTKLGFQYSFPAPTLDLLREVVNEYVEMKVFPRLLLP